MRSIASMGMAGVLLALAPAWAAAQTTPPNQSSAAPAVAVDQAMIEAARAIGHAALKPGVSVSDRNIAISSIPAYNFAVAFVTRPASKGPSGASLIHSKVTEIYYVLRGSGTSVTGLMTNAKEGTGSTTIGPGWSSPTPIMNGKSVRLGPGDIQIIPPGLGHVWSEIDEGGIDYITFRVDPEHHLALSK